MNSSPFRGVLLDVDGTLVASNDAHAHAWVAALAEEHIEVPFDRVRRLIGKGGDKLLPEVSGIKEDTPLGKAISRRRGEIFKERYLPTLRPCPGARDLLVHLRRQGLRLVAASSAKKDELQALLAVAGAADLLDGATSSDDVDRSKPDPDIIHAALDKIGLPAREVVLLGDTPYDVEAGERAGVSVIAFRSGGWGDEDLRGAIAVYEDPADLLIRYDTSPFVARPAVPRS